MPKVTYWRSQAKKGQAVSYWQNQDLIRKREKEWQNQGVTSHRNSDWPLPDSLFSHHLYLFFLPVFFCTNFTISLYKILPAQVKVSCNNNNILLVACMFYYGTKSLFHISFNTHNKPHSTFVTWFYIGGHQNLQRAKCALSKPHS